MIPLILLFPIILNCNNTKDKIKYNNKTLSMNTRNKLKDGINLSISFIENVEFNKYEYKGINIEDFYIEDFDDEVFKKDFFEFLKSRNYDANQFEQIFFIKLLLIRVQQVEDIRTYRLLSMVFQDEELSYFLEDYELNLFQLFLYKPYYFIKGAYKYQQSELLDYINKNLPLAYITKKEKFDILVDINFTDNSLLIREKIVESFTIKDLKQEIKQKANEIEGYFSPSLETQWKAETIIYYNVYKYLEEKISANLSKPEMIYYNVRYKPFFRQYIIEVNNKREFNTVHDPDGFTNLRKDKTTTSEVLQRIKSGEQIEVLDNFGDWFLVKTKEGQKGYVHKSRIKAE